jgi:uncharacterized membrane protein
MLVLGLAGLADAGYLTWYHYDPAVRVCVVTSGCETVNTSAYAAAGPIPVAVIGVAGYLLILGALVLGRWGSPSVRAGARYATYGMALVGAGFSLYLTAVEVLVLHAICTWCVCSAALITGICVLATLDVAGSP